MAYSYPTYKADKYGVYGDVNRPHRYKPASYHNRTAAKMPHKTRWRLTPPQQYEVFRVADEAFDLYTNGSGLYGFLDKMNEVLGLDNEEHIAFFPDAQDNNPWHGYPIDSMGIKDDIIKTWYEHDLINLRNYMLLLKRKL